jgi:hypothetical protein
MNEIISLVIVMTPVLVAGIVTKKIYDSQSVLKKGFYYYHKDESMLSNMQFIKSDKEYLYFRFLNTRKVFKLYKKEGNKLQLH